MKTKLLLIFFNIICFSVLAQDSLAVADTSQIIENADPSISRNMYNIMGIVFGIIGVIGTLYTIQSFLSKKREEKTYKYLFELAEKNIDKKVTEDILKQKKDEVKRHSEKITLLQDKIKEEIPLQARRAVLRDKFFTQSNSLMENYTSMKKIEGELKELKIDESIPKEILNEIENEIAPQYLLRERRSNAKNYITVITTAVAIISALLPYPFDRYLTFPLLIIAVPFVYQLIKFYLPENKAKREYIFTNILMYIFFGIGAFGLSISIIQFIIWLIDTESMEILFVGIVAGISVFIGLIGFIFYLKNKRLKREMDINE